MTRKRKIRLRTSPPEPVRVHTRRVSREPKPCVLGEIDELDEISGDQQLASVWCETHRRYERRWLLRPVSRRDRERPAQPAAKRGSEKSS